MVKQHEARYIMFLFSRSVCPFFYRDVRPQLEVSGSAACPSAPPQATEGTEAKAELAGDITELQDQILQAEKAGIRGFSTSGVAAGDVFFWV